MQTLRGRAYGGAGLPRMCAIPASRGVHLLRLSSLPGSTTASVSRRCARPSPPALLPAARSALYRPFLLPVTAAAPYHTSASRALPRHDRGGSAGQAKKPSASPAPAAEEPTATTATARKKGKPMLDQLLAEYQDLQFSVGGDDRPRAKEPSRAHRQQQPKRAASAVDGDDDENGEVSAPARPRTTKAQRNHAAPPPPSSMAAGEFTLDDLLAEYDDDGGGGGAKAKADKHGAAGRPKVITPADQMLAQREGEFTLDDLLADYDADADVGATTNAASRGAKGRSGTKGQTTADSNADRLANLESTFTLDDLLSDYDGDDKSAPASARPQTKLSTATAATTKGTRTEPAQQKRGEAWEDEWREDMARFGGAPDGREATLEDLIKTYQPPASASSTKSAQEAGAEEGSTSSSKARVRKELQRFVQSMITEDVRTTVEDSGVRDHAREAMEPLKATQASRRPRSAQQTPTPAQHAEERHEDGVEAAEMVTDDEEDDDDADEEGEDDLLENDDIDAELGDDRAFDALVAEAEEDDDEEIKDDEWLARELKSGQQVHPLEFSPLWRAASKHLPPRRTREEWERLSDGQIDPAFVGIDHSERELEGIEVTKRYDAVDENETDEQYMERMIRAEEEADMARAEKTTALQKPTKKAKAEAEAKLAAVDPVEAKKVKEKLKRKERRRLEYEKNMEKLKKHHKEGNVKMEGSEMYAHGANLMHWFSDPEGMKSKRDAILQKKCNKLQRMAELRKTREKRIDWPSDPTTADVEELLGMTRRQKRMANKIQSHLEDVLSEDLSQDSALGQLDINIDDVIMSRDMRIAKVYWRGSGDEDTAERLLHARTATLRGMLAYRAGVRFAPELVFYRESAESTYHEVSRHMDELQKQEGWDDATIKGELKRIRKEREAAANRAAKS